MSEEWVNITKVEYEKMIQDEIELAAANAKLARVREIHKSYDRNEGIEREFRLSESERYACDSCLALYGETVIYPCPTRRALDEEVELMEKCEHDNQTFDAESYCEECREYNATCDDCGKWLSHKGGNDE